MSFQRWGIKIPLLVMLGCLGISYFLISSVPVRNGLLVGFVVATAQSIFSIGSLRWAWNKPQFYWVWAGGLIFRLVVFGITATITYVYTKLNLIATLLSLVGVTTIFLIIESRYYSKR